MKFLTLIIFICSIGQVFSMDLSSIYKTKMKKTFFTNVEITKLRDFKILLIPGVLAESFDGKSTNQLQVGFIFEEGFGQQKKLLEKNNLNYEYLNFDTESSIYKNSQAIIKAIEESPEKLILYTHSKGGLDTLEALRQRPDLINKIHGWVSVQSPFWGAPFAEFLYQNKVLRDSGKNLFEWLGGDLGGMSALTIQERKGYMGSSEISNLINLVNKKVKFINYATYKSDTLGLDTPMEVVRNLTFAKYGKNDGVVPLNSALMRDHGFDINYIVESGVDHLMTTTKYRPDEFDMLEFFQRNYSQQTHLMSLLKMLL